ncbi:MAG: hypothetical protein JWS12_740 [Candidatus Saccharibacteria bacterium]|nr:hypothetical protein [Candidatus Saccharibacteria bacterium]
MEDKPFTGETANLRLGEQIADHVRQQLSYRLLYPDIDDEFTELKQHLDNLSGLTLSQDEFVAEIERQSQLLQLQKFRERLTSHRTVLAAGNVLVPDDADDTPQYTWTSIPPKTRTLFIQRLDEIEAGTVPVDISFSQGSLGRIPAYIKATVFSALDEDLQEICEIVPERDAHKKRLMRRAFARLTRTEVRATPYVDLNSMREKTEEKRISRKVRTLNDLLVQLQAEPYGFIVKKLLVEQEDMLATLEANVDKFIAEGNSAILQNLDPHDQAAVKSRPAPKPQPTPEQTPKAPQSETDQVTELSEENDQDLSEVYFEQLGSYPLSVPWINEGQITDLPIERIETSDSQILVIRAIGNSQLGSISNIVRDHAQTSRDEQNLYDAAILQQGRRMAAGIMPRRTGTSVKRVRTANKDMATGNRPIWYTVDRIGTRVYFIEGKIDEFADLQLQTDLEVSPETICMLVIAETDKNHQPSVLRVITGNQH